MQAPLSRSWIEYQQVSPIIQKFRITKKHVSKSSIRNVIGLLHRTTAVIVVFPQHQDESGCLDYPMVYGFHTVQSGLFYTVASIIQTSSTRPLVTSRTSTAACDFRFPDFPTLSPMSERLEQ